MTSTWAGPAGKSPRRTKIVCTIGPASSSVDELDRLAAAGMDVARLNFSHGTHGEHAAVIERVRHGDERWGRPVAILQDLQGPKVRLGTFGDGGGATVELSPGASFTLTGRPIRAPRRGPRSPSPRPCARCGSATASGWTTG